MESSFSQGTKDTTPKDSGDPELESLLKDIQQKIKQLPESKGVLTKAELMVIMEADQALTKYSQEKKITDVEISFPAPTSPDEKKEYAKAFLMYKKVLKTDIEEASKDGSNPVTVAIGEIDKALLLIAKFRDLKGVKIAVSTAD